MTKHAYPIATVLSLITGRKLAPMASVYSLIGHLLGTEPPADFGACVAAPSAIKRLLHQHPKFDSVLDGYQSEMLWLLCLENGECLGADIWIDRQRKRFGDLVEIGGKS